jgi:hypothetical protein
MIVSFQILNLKSVGAGKSAQCSSPPSWGCYIFFAGYPYINRKSPHPQNFRVEISWMGARCLSSPSVYNRYDDNYYPGNGTHVFHLAFVLGIVAQGSPYLVSVLQASRRFTA